MRRNFVYPPQSVLLHRAGGPWQGSYAGKAQGSLERERPRKVISNPPKSTRQVPRRSSAPRHFGLAESRFPMSAVDGECAYDILVRGHSPCVCGFRLPSRSSYPNRFNFISFRVCL